ncbi:MAG: hypothetical protein LH617_08295, partial [Ramlibacter sp.]|nr:hypothetical protein [Ramlibacter sp.]
ALSRLAILDYLAPKDHRKERSREQERRADAAAAAAETETDADAGGRSDARKRSRWARPRWFSGMTGVASSWWQRHPAQMAFEMITPPLQSYMRRKPFQVMGLAVGVGVLIVVTRPWRLISLTTLVVAIVKSSQLSGVVMSALSDAQGWRSQQQGREPQL